MRNPTFSEHRDFLRKRVVLLVSMLVLSGQTAIGGQHLLNKQAPDFELNDQYEHVHTLKSLRGRPLVLVASDKDGAEQSRDWGTLIHKKYGERVGIVRIADLRKVPFFMRGKIRNDFKKDGKMMLLDWDGLVYKSYDFKKGVANVVLIDKKGAVRFVHSGAPEPEDIERLCREIDNAE